MSTESAPPPEANPNVPRPVGRQAPLGPVAFVLASVRMAWRWLTRMRTALYLLAALALLTMVATLVPQEPNVPGTVAGWLAGESGPGPGVARVLAAVGAFDVYGSAAFLALTLLLFLSLTACLLPRIRAWLRLVARSRPPLLRQPGGGDLVGRFSTDLAPDEVLARAQRLLSGRRWRVRAGAPGDDAAPAQLAAEKGLWTREGGSLVFHLSFYVLLAAVVLGQLLTFEGQRGLVEGEVGFTDTAVSYWSYRPGRWFHEDDHSGWRLELDRFDVDWVRDPLAPGAGQPTRFRSEVTITPRGGEPYATVIDSNRPAMIDGMRITQLDWGYAPRVRVEVDGEVVHDGFVLTRLGEGGVYRGAVKAPAAEPDVGLELFFSPFAPDGDDGLPVRTGVPWDAAPLLLFRQWRGDLQLGATQQTLTELDTDQMRPEGGAYLRPGQVVELGDVTVRYVEHRRWVGYQVSSRPQVPWLMAGAGLLTGGLILSLYAYRRRLWVLTALDPASGRTLVTVAGRTFQRPEAFETEHPRIVEDLAGATNGRLLEAPAPRPAPESAGADAEVMPR